MRQDMKHVIIDRPRTGGDGGKSKPPKGSNRRWQRIPVEDQPRSESTSRRRRYGCPADTLSCSSATGNGAYLLHGRYVYIKSKRQLGKAKIHKLQLWKTALGKKTR
jgi:hypothetical protein